MADLALVMQTLALLVIAAPAALLLALGLTSLVDRRLSEKALDRWVQWAVTIALMSAVGIFVGMLISGDRHVVLDLGNWIEIHPSGNTADDHGSYHFKVKLVFDRLSVPFVVLSLGLCGVIGAFAIRYMHREPGFNRFFVLYAVFVLGMVVTALAGTIETLFTGWELVGLSSVFLVAFFQERPGALPQWAAGLDRLPCLRCGAALGGDDPAPHGRGRRLRARTRVRPVA